MLPEEMEPGDWLRHAWSDLELARMPRNSRILVEALCFHAQQATEKALKAVLVFRSTPFPKTHNIRTLIDLLPEGLNLPEDAKRAAILTDYAVMAGYPGDFEPVTQEEYLEAVRIAEAVVRWAEKTVNHSTPRPKGRGLLEVHPERRLQPRLERRGFAPSNG